MQSFRLKACLVPALKGVRAKKGGRQDTREDIGLINIKKKVGMKRGEGTSKRCQTKNFFCLLKWQFKKRQNWEMRDKKWERTY